MALVHNWEELDSLPVKIISSLWVCSLSNINLFLPFCIVKDFDEDMLCRHLRPNLGLGEQKPCTLSTWRTTHVEPSPTHIYLGDSSGHFSQKVAKFWREGCSETVICADCQKGWAKFTGDALRKSIPELAELRGPAEKLLDGGGQRGVCPEAGPSLAVCACDSVSFTENCELGEHPSACPASPFPQDLARHPHGTGWWWREGDHQQGPQSWFLLPCQELFGGCHPGGGKAWKHGLQSSLGWWGNHGVQSSTFTFITDLEDSWRGFLGFGRETWDRPSWAWQELSGRVPCPCHCSPDPEAVSSVVKGQKDVRVLLEGLKWTALNLGSLDVLRSGCWKCPS